MIKISMRRLERPIKIIVSARYFFVLFLSLLAFVPQVVSAATTVREIVEEPVVLYFMENDLPRYYCEESQDCADHYAANINAQHAAIGSQTTVKFINPFERMENTVQGQPFSVTFDMEVTAYASDGTGPFVNVNPGAAGTSVTTRCPDPVNGVNWIRRIITGWPHYYSLCVLRISQEDNPNKEGGCPGEKRRGNPCNVATGNKYQSETDIAAKLGFVRSYNSNNLPDLDLGKGWTHTYQKRLLVSLFELTLVSNVGRGEPWRKLNGLWVGDVDSDYIITENAAGFAINKQNGDTEEYDSDGRLISETDKQGKQTTFSYDGNAHLVQVTDHFGLSLNLAYDAYGHIISVTDASNATYKYEYDAINNLTGVIYPDLTPGDDSDNPKRIYHYENPDFPNHLTGITDAMGDRYATYAYDENGKAILTEHAKTTGAVGQEQIQLDYQ